MTRKDYDEVKHYGNVSKINGAEVEPVDIITFGSPCQDLSVAGKRMGLKHSAMGDEETTRSGLFFEAIRIIKEMREATNNEYPKYAVYENVSGVFSSNKGYDFHAVLEALCSVCDDTVSVPEPYDPKRTKLVWNKAGEIVGDNYSVAWRTLDAQYWGVPQRRKRIYLVADFTGRCAGEILFKSDSLHGNHAESGKARQGSTADAVGGVDGSNGNGGQLAATLISSYGTKWNGNAGAYNGENFVLQKHSVDGSVGNGIAVVQPVIALQANGIDRADTAGCNGCGWRENESYTLNTVDRHAVCYDARGNGDGETACFQNTGRGWWNESETAATVRTACGGDSVKANLVAEKKRRYIIRRLTPTECQKLQGFPNIVEVDMTDITRDELVAIVLSAGYIKVNVETGDVFATRGPGGIERNNPVLLSGANVNGYKVYSLHANGVKKQIRANRLVWIAAHGAIPDGMVVDHINNDKQDNRIANLQLLTAGQNSTKAHDDGCYLVGDDNPNCKIKECERKTISFLYWHTNMPYRVLAEHFGIGHSRAQQIIHEYNWSSLAPYDPADAEFWESVRKTYAEINGKKYKPTKNLKKWHEGLHTDSAEYKAYGNGLALPCAEYVIHGIAEQGAKTLGSLFDGIGGFPLAGVLNGITPLWASEVEPYCIAVTKSRFKEENNA